MTREEVKKFTKQLGAIVAIIVAAIVATIELLDKSI